MPPPTGSPDPVEAALPHGFVLPHNRFSRTLDRFIVRAGEIAKWLWPLLMAVIVLQVTLRYGFGRGSVMLEEIQWHIYSIGFMIGISYCIEVDRHVRVDALAEHWSLRRRAWIELIGLTLFLLPFALLVAYQSAPFVATSWRLAEVSVAPGGLPYRWAIKSFLVIGFALIAIVAFSRITRCTTLLYGVPRALPPSDGGRA